MTNLIDKILMTETVLVVMPAYGRRYSSTEEMMKAWHDGSDFKIINGPYCSVRDIEKMKTDGWDSIILVNAAGNQIESIELDLHPGILT